MKLYLASQFSTKDQIREYARLLQQDGHKITSSWLREKVPANATMQDVTSRYMRTHATRDLEDIWAADILVLFTVDPEIPTKRGGRHVEFGYALAAAKGLIIVGPRENIFHRLPEVIQVADFPALREHLRSVSAEKIAA